jgi:hypothetical protein
LKALLHQDKVLKKNYNRYFPSNIKLTPRTPNIAPKTARKESFSLNMHTTKGKIKIGVVAFSILAIDASMYFKAARESKNPPKMFIKTTTNTFFKRLKFLSGLIYLAKPVHVDFLVPLSHQIPLSLIPATENI